MAFERRGFDLWWLPRRAEIWRTDIRAHANPSLSQTQYRGRNDDGSETTATWKANANTDWTQPVDESFRVRFVVQETAGGAENNVTFQLQYNLNGAGWLDVTTASAVVRGVDTQLADTSPTTDQIGGSGSFLAGEQCEDGLADISRPSFAGNDHSEVEFGVQLLGADVDDADSIQLRVVRSGGSLEAWTATPTITASEEVAANFDVAFAGTAPAPALAATVGHTAPDNDRDVAFAATAGIPVLSASVATEVPDFAASFAATAPLPSLASSVDHEAPTAGLSFAATAPTPTLDADVAHEAPGFPASFAATAPLPSLTASVSHSDPASDDRDVSFAATAPVPSLTAAVEYEAPGREVSFDGAAPVPTLEASVAHQDPASDDRAVTFSATAPVPTLAAGLEHEAPPGVTVEFGAMAPLPELAASMVVEAPGYGVTFGGQAPVPVLVVSLDSDAPTWEVTFAAMAPLPRLAPAGAGARKMLATVHLPGPTFATVRMGVSNGG